MPTLYTHSDANTRKSWLLLAGFFLFIITVGYIFSYALDDPSLLVIAVAVSIISSLFSYWFSDKIVLAMSSAKEIDFSSHRELYRLVENLCIAAGLPLPKIYIIEDSAPNAFATGRDPQHAVIAVTSGLLAKLDRSELEGVLAHELSHIGNRDIRLATLVTVLVGIVVLMADWFRRWTFWGGGRRRSNGNNQLQAIMFFIAIFLSVLAPIFAYLLQFAISRKREFLADADGALLTRYPEGLARALEKIAADPEPLEVANRATAHLFIASPFKTDRPGAKIGFWQKAFLTHPPAAERIAALRGIANS
ncbi:zinc metalloprotease HtpX [Candidatus Falkowbacteria bacterium CG_4_10_14_0_2_um_filter_48_10]|uniref:Protease HtpX homolog n=1 Tax=Candidatus Falkowbacteria bacterium CG23_combo_of_CG06-09_8_20_14_all_49_15 TaxID=1974572 RepID=A0A2G9ZKU3_9BACT|nr:MAG: zinc metalloprotease HtpX [Candidatus Falkowbacteria bacterium CG23_combo_of_CG06-09_8_20_14_all_49_15]PJA08283.1 MAG: zinc metalloprotease HtpX [Candidatus Falkowbacteria bacterium CG_4_10_14_0_2_um_filter_48_10]